jgi:hypothetical protein
LSGQPKLEHREQRLDHRGSFFPSETPNRRIFQEKFVKNFVPKFNSRFSVLVDFLGKSFDPQGTSSSLLPPLPPLPPSFSFFLPFLPLPPLLPCVGSLSSLLFFLLLHQTFRALPFLSLLFLLLSKFPSPAFQLNFWPFPQFSTFSFLKYYCLLLPPHLPPLSSPSSSPIFLALFSLFSIPNPNPAQFGNLPTSR